MGFEFKYSPIEANYINYSFYQEELPFTTNLQIITSYLPTESSISSLIDKSLISSIQTSYFNSDISEPLTSQINDFPISSNPSFNSDLMDLSSIPESESYLSQSTNILYSDSNILISTNSIINSYSQIIEEKKIIIEKIEEKKEEFVKNLQKVINKTEIEKEYKIIGEDFTLLIKPINSSYLENTTQVIFNKCEKILRDSYNISQSRILTFLQLEIVNKDKQSLVNQIEYQVYDDNKNLLDLNLCNDTNIQILYTLKNNNFLDLLSISNFKKSGIDVFNINDNFFNDICHPYNDSKNDVVLEDRIKYIYKNYSLCDNGCTYNQFNDTYQIISCDCKVKANISTNESELNIYKYDDLNLDSNFGIIKCYNLVFSFKGKLYNIGFWIFLFLVLLHIPFLFSYFYKGIKSIKEYIIKEMIKYGYLKNNKKGNKIIKRRTLKNDTINFPPRKNKNGNKIKNKLHSNSSIKNLGLSEKENKNQFNSNLDKLNKKEIDEDLNNKNKTSKTKKRIKREKKNGKLIKPILYKKNSQKKFFNFGNIPTQGIEKEQIIKNGNNNFNFNLININLKNIKDFTPRNSNMILNNYTYEEAIKYDMRSVCAIFYIFLLSKQAIFHAFLYKSPLELYQLRVCLLLFIISSDLALNAIFYLDDKISKKYKYVQNLFLFTFNNNLTIILLSTLIGFIFMTLFTNLSNSINNIRDIFRKEEEKIKKNKHYIISEKRKKEIFNEIELILKKYKLKVIILITLEILLILFFWYYVTAFCHVYSRTQLSWILDSSLSILSRLVIELLLSLGFAKLYRIAIEANIKCLYNIVLFFYCFG